MSTTSRGKRAESRFDAILTNNLGYRMVARACNRGFYRGGQWQSGGAIDLMDAFDFVHARPAGLALSQVCHDGGQSPRRAKLRAALSNLPSNALVILAAWDHDAGNFHIYRAAEDFLSAGWVLDSNSKIWPWEEPSKQVPL